LIGLTGSVLPPSIMPDVPSNYPTYIPLPSLGQGSRNSLGLTPKGEIAIRYMMQKGMLIDIDHMSEKSADAALAMATLYGYPVNSGHNDFRGPGAMANGFGANNENARTDEQVTKIYALGGMVGLGHGGGSTNFVNHYRYGLSLSNGKPLAIGTDVNGFFALPGPPQVGETISPSFPKVVTGVRVWDFNHDGMAHYGLFPAFIESMKSAGMTTGEQSTFFSSAERFAQMWEKCDSSKANVLGP
jgi:microsomal dipeptidase-like Zn-dependent dipeptidase